MPTIDRQITTTGAAFGPYSSNDLRHIIAIHEDWLNGKSVDDYDKDKEEVARNRGLIADQSVKFFKQKITEAQGR